MLYGSHPELSDAIAYTGRAVRRGMARDDYANERERQLRHDLRHAPLSATIDANWGRAGTVPVSEELVAWVMETHVNPDATLAEALFDPVARLKLIEAFSAARADLDADQALGRGEFEDDARGWK